MKRWRYRKITPEAKKKMKQMRDEGYSYQEIADAFGIVLSTAQYHLNPQYRELTIKKVKKSSPYKKQRHNKERDRKYFRERYRSDPEFRERVKKHARRYATKIHRKSMNHNGSEPDVLRTPPRLV